jgi:hypothetical protein
MKLSVTCDLQSLSTWHDRTAKDVYRAVNMAGSSALRAMRAEASRRIREKKGVQSKQMDAVLSLTYPTATASGFVWTLIAKARPLPLITFGARQVGSGVSVEVTKGSRKIVRTAFIATMQSGHKGVFQREGPKQIMRRGRYAGKKRQPIHELFSASVASALIPVAPEVIARGESVFRSTFERLMRPR